MNMVLKDRPSTELDLFWKLPGFRKTISDEEKEKKRNKTYWLF